MLSRKLDLFGFRLTVGVDWAPDIHWDWTHADGDVHHDVVALVVLRRAGYPPTLRLTVGPAMAMALIGKSARPETEVKP